MRINNFAILLLILICSNNARSDSLCHADMVKFWQEFSARHGIDTVPAFLIKNGCLNGPDDIVHLYDLYQQLLDDPYLGLSYEARYYVEQYSEEAQVYEQVDGLIGSGNVEFSNSPTVDDSIYVDTKNAPDIEDFKADSLPKTVQDKTIQKSIKQKSQNQKTYNPLILFFIFLTMLLLIKYKKKDKNIPLIKDKTCLDCGSKVKPGRNQCFVCGSYV